jgi:hypothetical protein
MTSPWWERALRWLLFPFVLVPIGSGIAVIVNSHAFRATIQLHMLTNPSPTIVLVVFLAVAPAVSARGPAGERLAMRHVLTGARLCGSDVLNRIASVIHECDEGAINGIEARRA